MILIFGGAYQGKLDFAIENYEIREREIYTCEMDSIKLDFDKKVINHAERFVYACVKEDFNAKEILEDHLEKLQDKIIIFDDISQGIVSIDPVERAWREANGRAMTYLGQQAEEVIRVFCGIGSKVK